METVTTQLSTVTGLKCGQCGGDQYRKMYALTANKNFKIQENYFICNSCGKRYNYSRIKRYHCPIMEE